MNLAELERFFYRTVRAGAPPAGVDRVFTGTAGLGAVRRMGIYHSAYWARQLRTLVETFPHVARALGDDRFRRIAREYLAAHPSEKPAIELVGERFPGYVEGRRRDLPSLVPDLARFEWARTEALLAPDPPSVVRREELGELEFWRVRAVFAAHVRVLRVANDALAFAAHEDASVRDSSRIEASCTVVYRRAHKVTQVRLEDPEGVAVEVAAKGRAFAEVCEAFGAVPVADIARKIGAWLDRAWLERLEEV